MGLIHKKLYTGDHFSTIEMSDYLKQLGESLLDSFGLDSNKVKINTDVEQIRLDVDTAIPLGLICNELITNSLKYAFPADRVGEIHVKLCYIDKSNLLLEISDNGQGEVKENHEAGTSFGYNLVEMLSKKLKGELSLDKSNGYKATLHFKI
jgi:two-component sensor histidine kinase